MRRGDGADGKVVAVIGDGAMTGGVAFEAIHQAGGLGTPLVVILNDNGMSIAPNVGALSRYFNRVRLEPGLWKAREGVEEKLTKLPGRDRRGVRAARPAAEGVDQGVLGARACSGRSSTGPTWASSTATTCARCGARCAPPSRPSARSSSTARRSRARASRPPRTAAWRAWRSGMPPSPTRSPSACRRRPSRRRKPAAPPQYTQVFGEALVAECERDTRVVGITAAMNSGTGLNLLQKAMPERYFDVGIAEQQALLFAAGLALQGARPVAAIYSTFLQRAYDQIVHDVCLQQLPVVLAMDRAGLVGDDGPTHHGVFDIAYLRCLPNIDADGAARRGDARAHAPHRAAPRRRAGRPALPARRGGRRAAPGRAASCSRSAPARSCARASASRSSATAPASARRSGRPTCSPRAGWTSRSPTRASPSRSTRACSPSSPPSTSCSSPSRRACSPAASAPASGRRSRDGGLAPRILRVGLPDRYVTHGAPKLLHAEVGYTAERIAERIQAAVLDPRGSVAAA